MPGSIVIVPRFHDFLSLLFEMVFIQTSLLLAILWYHFKIPKIPLTDLPKIPQKLMWNFKGDKKAGFKPHFYKSRTLGHILSSSNTSQKYNVLVSCTLFN